MGSSAEYMAAYRAARRKAPPPRDCQKCRESFTPERDDARFCSQACRAGKWRETRHRKLIPANPDSTCGHVLDPTASVGGFCGRHATGSLIEWRNGSPVRSVEHLCAEHAPASVTCDEHSGRCPDY